MRSSRRQIAEICRILTRDCGDQPAWSNQGPTEAAFALRQRADIDLNGSQRVRSEIAWWLWEGGKGPPFGSLVELLERDWLRRLGSLLIALSEGSDSVNRWIKLNGGSQGDA